MGNFVLGHGLRRSLLSIFILGFSLNLFAKTFDAEAEKAFSFDLVSETGCDGKFGKVDGPSWISVSAKGQLFGSPSMDDLGTHDVQVSVSKDGCQVANPPDSFTVTVKVTTTKTSLLVFSAPWCRACKKGLPELRGQLAKDVGNAADLHTRYYVETGATPYDKPTVKSARDYGDKLGMSGQKFVADAWQWSRYVEYFGKAYALPAAVIISPAGKVTHKFEADSFDVQKISAAVSAKVTPSTASMADILWVVDNSGSMGVHQAAVAKLSATFFDGLGDNAALDWQMSVVSTTLTDKLFINFGDLTSSTSNPKDVFSAAIMKLSTYGDGVEKPFASAIAALKSGKFARDKSTLAVIFVTDAEEQSAVKAADMLTDLVAINPASSEVVTYGLFASDDSTGCAAGANDGPWKYAGSVYEALIDQTKGKSYSLCKDLEASVRAIGADIATRK